MKGIASALMLALCLMCAAPAFAFDTPATVDAAGKDKIQLKAAAYQHYATTLGYPDFVFGNIVANGAMYTLKYVPAKETLATAKTMVSITVYGLSGDKEKDDAKMASSINMLQSMYRKSAKMVDDKTLNNELDEKNWFTQFYYGPEGEATYVTAAYIRSNTKPSEAAFVQIISRSLIPKEKALWLYQQINPQATLPRAKKKSAVTGWEAAPPTTPVPESILQ